MPLSAENVALGLTLIRDFGYFKYADNAIGVPPETLGDGTNKQSCMA